jgi:catechol 2,3-dioxygenase-like lactoylglutathione lyase family enzyme
MSHTTALRLSGVDHVARPTWKLRETVHFYQTIMGLKLTHAVTAKGWGREKEAHPDFIHFFFDTGQGSKIAFFHYIGVTEPSELAVPKGYIGMASHTAWRVQSQQALLQWQGRLKSFDVRVSEPVRHELFESVYFRDPNNYPLEITRSLREMCEPDSTDAQLTIAAAIFLEDRGDWNKIEQLWQKKAEFVREHQNAVVGQAR